MSFLGLNLKLIHVKSIVKTACPESGQVLLYTGEYVIHQVSLYSTCVADIALRKPLFQK